MNEHVLAVLLVVSGALFAGLSTAAVVFARWIAQRLNKVGINLSPDQLAALDKWVGLAVLYVEERAHKYLRGYVTSAPQSPEDKQELAVRVARELAPDNLEKFSDKALAIAVDAKVQERRASLPAPSIPPPSPSTPPLPR